VGLIEDIRDKAVSSKTPLEDVLRHCMVLAAKLKHEPLKQWTHNELNGYASSADVPDYRVVWPQLRTKPIDNFERGGEPISTRGMSPELARLVRSIQLRQGVAELEAWQKQGGRKIAVPEELRDHADSVSISWRVLEAYRDVDAPMLHGVLSSIRNRVLEFVLSLEEASSQIEEAAPGTKPVRLSELDERFGVIIMGNSNVVTIAGNSALVQKIERQVVRNDLGSLKAFLVDQGATDANIKQLGEVIETAKPEDLDKPRSALSKWVNTTAKSIASGSKTVAMAAAKEAVLLATRYYFGELTGVGGSPSGGGV
jgi:AbiTii